MLLLDVPHQVPPHFLDFGGLVWRSRPTLCSSAKVSSPSSMHHMWPLLLVTGTLDSEVGLHCPIVGPYSGWVLVPGTYPLYVLASHS